MFSTFHKTNIKFSVTFILSSAHAFNLDWSKISWFGKELTLSQTSPGFYVYAVQVFLKTLREKEKLLVTSNFSFSHSVFYTFQELCCHFHLKLSAATSFSLEESKIFCLGKC